MTNQQYFEGLLRQQDLTEGELRVLRSLRERVEAAVGALQGSPRFYYGGSYGKHTMIRESYDLDVVAYWPHDCGYAIRDIYNAVGKQLRGVWPSAHQKTVSWEINFEGGFHVDVVRGRAIDSSFRYANLYRRDRDSTLQTSIKVHIDTIKDSGRRDAIRLMKLWKARKGLRFKTFILELLTIDGCKGQSLTDLEPQLLAAFRYLNDNILTVSKKDPANSNNIVTDDLSTGDRLLIKAAADAAIRARVWNEVFEA